MTSYTIRTAKWHSWKEALLGREDKEGPFQNRMEQKDSFRKQAGGFLSSKVLKYTKRKELCRRQNFTGDRLLIKQLS